MGIVSSAMSVLDSNPGTAYCLACWARVADIVATDMQALVVLARAFGGLTDRVFEDGVCHRCFQRGGIVRKLAEPRPERAIVVDIARRGGTSESDD